MSEVLLILRPVKTIITKSLTSELMTCGIALVFLRQIHAGRTLIWLIHSGIHFGVAIRRAKWSPARDLDPWLSSETFQAGGFLPLVTGCLVATTIDGELDLRDTTAGLS